MRTSDAGVTDMHSTAMGIGASSSSSSASKRLWFRINHSWYGSNFCWVRTTEEARAFEDSVPIEGNVLHLPMVLLEAPQRLAVSNERPA